MAIPHAESGQVIDIGPRGDQLKQDVTKTLVKTERLQVLRMVLPAGKEIAEHQAPGEITVQCLEGSIVFHAHDQPHTLRAGQMLYLEARVPHSLKALEDAGVLVTILL